MTPINNSGNGIGGEARLYIGPWPYIHQSSTRRGSDEDNGQPWPDFTDSILLDCQLWNRTYVANFSYLDGEQHITVDQSPVNFVAPINTISYFWSEFEHILPNERNPLYSSQECMTLTAERALL
jgi:hypothetical protein